MKGEEEEYQKLKALFRDCEPAKSELADGLIRKAAYLKCQLDSLEEQTRKTGGPVQTSSKGNTRTNPSYKEYLTSLSVYQSIVRTLASILGKSAADQDDDFDTFMEDAGK